jgi:hypothetical protein
MFQICVPNQKVQRKKQALHFMKSFINEMIRNIKIHNIFNINEISNLINVFIKIKL